MAGQCRSIYKDSTQRGNGELGPQWAKHETTWEDFQLEVRIYKGTCSSYVIIKAQVYNGFILTGASKNLLLVGGKMAKAYC